MLQPSQQRLDIPPALHSALMALQQVQQADYQRLELYRQYTKGNKWARLTTAQEALLGRDPKFAINICPTVIKAKTNRLKLTGWEVGGLDDPDMAVIIEDVLFGWYTQANMTGLSNDAHYITSRDGNGYLLVEYDNENGTPVFNVEEAYDGATGAMIVYRNRKPMYGMKRWSEPALVASQEPVERMNLYHHDRVERFYSVTKDPFINAGFIPYDLDGLAPVLWLTDTGTESGTPLGLPLFHFKSGNYGQDHGVSDIHDVVPSLQDALNDAGISTLTAAKLAGFPVNYIFGVPKGTSTYRTYPGALLVHEGQGTAGQFPAANLLQLIEEENNIKRTIALITDTPLHMLNPSGQVAAEGTLQQMDIALLARVENAQQDFGNTWAKAMEYALKLEAIYGSLDGALVEQVNLTTVWAEAAMRNELTDAQTLEIHQRLGVPDEIIWKKLGYTPDEIQEMKTIKGGEVIDIVRQMQTEQANKLMSAPDMTGAIGAMSNEATNPSQQGSAGIMG